MAYGNCQFSKGLKFKASLDGPDVIIKLIKHNFTNIQGID